MSSVLKVLSILVFILFAITPSKALPLNQTEYNLIIPLLNSFGFNTSVFNQSNFCDYTFNLHNIECRTSPIDSSVNVIAGVNIKSKLPTVTSLTIYGENFTNYQYANRYNIENAFAAPNFLSYISDNSPYKGPTLTCAYCGITSIPSGLNLNVLGLTGSVLVQVIPLSYLNKISQLFFSDLASTSQVTFTNDLTTFNNYTSTFNSLTNNIPDLSLLGQLTTANFHLLNNFDESSWVNLATVKSLITPLIDSMNFSKTFTFPPAAFQILNKGIKFYRVNFTGVTEPILPTTPMVVFTVDNSNSFSTPDGDTPFLEFPSGTNSVSLTNMGLTKFNFSTLRNVNSATVAYNKIIGQLMEYNFDPTKDVLAFPDSKSPKLSVMFNNINGTVPNWFCQVHTSFGGNKFTGVLPPCYACFLKDPNIKSALGTGNNFTNVVSGNGPSTCPTFKITSIGVYKIVTSRCTSYKLGISGTDLGVSSQITQTNAYGNVFNWVPYVQNQFYVANFDRYGAHKEFFAGNGVMNLTFAYLSNSGNTSFILNFKDHFNTPMEIPWLYNRSEPCGAAEPTSTTTTSTTSTPTPTPSSSHHLVVGLLTIIVVVFISLLI